MRKYLVGILAIVMSVLVLTALAPVYAENLTQQACQATGAQDKSSACVNQADDPLTGPGGIIGRAIDLLSILVGVASVIVIMVAGFSFITSQGEPAALSKAKNSIIFAVIGIVIVVLAQVIAGFVVKQV